MDTLKLAYIGYSLESCYVMSELSNYFNEIDVYLKVPDSNLRHHTLDEYSIMVGVYNIPPEIDIQTKVHVQSTKKVSAKIDLLKNEFLSLNKFRFKKQIAYSENRLQAQVNIFDLSDVRSVHFDDLLKNVKLECNSKSKEYQFLLIENQDLLVSNSTPVEDIFKKKPISSHRYVHFTFKSSNLSGIDRKFLFFSDKESSSMIDNLYICEFEGTDLIHVNAWIPAMQSIDEKFIQFYANRIIDVIKKNFDFIKVINFISATPRSASGFFNQKGIVKNNKLSMAIPSFSYWSKSQIANYFVNMIELKIKKTQKMHEKLNRIRSLT